MLLILFLIFVVTPIVELAVIVQVAGSTGVMNTIGLLVLVSLVGAWLVRREGLGILRRAQAELAKGRMPGRELVDGLLVLLAGALMLTPGFVTDAVGLALLFPPVRAVLRLVATRRLSRWVDAGRTLWTFGTRSKGGGFTTGPSGGPILDADSWEDGADGHRRLPPNGD